MKNLISRKLLLSTAAATMLLGSAITANAAQEDVFDAEYYAETYADVQAAVGNDEAALLQHYLTFGITEGRSASAYFNAAAYKAANADLEAVFGDDWDAYADHYIAFGVSEGRNAGGEREITDAEYAAAAEKMAAVETVEAAVETPVLEDTATADTSVPTEEATETPVAEDVDFYVNGFGVKIGVTSADAVREAVAASSLGDEIGNPTSMYINPLLNIYDNDDGTIAGIDALTEDTVTLFSLDGVTLLSEMTPDDFINVWGTPDRDYTSIYGNGRDIGYDDVDGIGYSLVFSGDRLSQFITN